MSGAIFLLSHMPSWCGEGQLYCLTFICPKILHPFGSRLIICFVTMKAVITFEETYGILHNLWDL